MAGPTLFRPSDITLNQVGFWKFDDDALDSSVNSYDLTPVNVPTYATPDYFSSGEKSAVLVSASSQHYTHADNADLRLLDAFSLGCWVNKTASATYNLFDKNGDGGEGGYRLQINSSDQILVKINGSTVITVTSGTVSNGKWHHIVITYDQTFLIVYLDGNQLAITPHSTDNTSVAGIFYIGADDATNTFGGVMKDAFAYSAALSPIQVKSFAMGVDLASKSYRPNNVGTPTAYWKMNEPSSGAGAVSRADSAGSHTLTDVNTVQSGPGYVEGLGANLELSNSEYFSAADSDDWAAGSGDYTIATWVKYETIPSGSHEFTIFGQNEDGTNYLWFRSNGATQFQFHQYQGGATISITFTVPTQAIDTWYHIVLRKTGTLYELFIDGTLIDSDTDVTDWANFSGLLWIGRHGDGTSAYSDGLIVDYAIWKGYAVTDNQIKSLASAFPVQQTGIVSYWKLDEESGTRADAIGSNTLQDNASVLFGVGKVDNAADFERDNSEYLSITDGSQVGLDLVGKYPTFLVWLKPESISVLQYIIEHNGTGFGYDLHINAGNTIGSYFNGGVAITTGVVTAGTFIHVAFTLDGAAHKLWLNSVNDGTSASVLIPADDTDPVRLGSRSTTVTSLYDGLMDEFVIAERWFREEEIKSVYVKGLNGLTADSEPVSGNTGRFFAIL